MSRWIIPFVVTVVFNGWMYRAMDQLRTQSVKEMEDMFEENERHEEARETMFRNSFNAMKKELEEMEKKRKCWIV